MPDKVTCWKNQKLPFYKNKVINACFLATKANLETSIQLLRWELMNPVLKTSNSLSTIHWGVYLKGLAESCRIIIRKTYLCCFPTIIFRNTTNLKTFVYQTWDWAKSQHIRAGKKELKCSSRKQKAPELQQYWGITAFTLSGWKQPQALSHYSQASVGQPALEWMLWLAWTAEYEISATSTRTVNSILEGQCQLHSSKEPKSLPQSLCSTIKHKRHKAAQSTHERDSQAQQNTKSLYYCKSINSKNSILK